MRQVAVRQVAMRQVAAGLGRPGVSQPRSQVAAGYSCPARLKILGKQGNFSGHRQRRGGAMSGGSISSSPPTLGQTWGQTWGQTLGQRRLSLSQRCAPRPATRHCPPLIAG
ncbi:MAG: hypothetical protein DCF21_16200 [Leptolyngbya sp.]|nr:MAG: hypothetical protein DCF21_16200 [Leptolyngbya sp.]